MIINLLAKYLTDYCLGDDYSLPPSKVDNSNTGVWRQNTLQAGHEFGHIMGLADRYMINKEKKVISDSGYSENIMGAYGGKTEQSNINDLIKNVMKQSDPFSVPSYFEHSIYINVKNREIVSNQWSVTKHRAERPTLRTALYGRRTTIAPKQYPHRNDKTSRRAKANG